MHKYFYLLFSALLLLLNACSEWVEYSPYDTEISKRHPNKDEIKRISNITALSADDNFTFALLSDIHNCYDDLEDALAILNKRNDIRFVVCCGDITNAGLAQEYEWYVDMIRKSKHPFINVVGNHDYRSNGGDIFTKIFGPPNTSFVAGDYKFILFDDVIWEKGNQSPDYAWLNKEISDKAYRNVVISHIPPWADQVAANGKQEYQQLIHSENAMLCLHGHEHHHKDSVLNGTRTIVTEAMNAREFDVISLHGGEITIRTTRF